MTSHHTAIIRRSSLIRGSKTLETAMKLVFDESDIKTAIANLVSEQTSRAVDAEDVELEQNDDKEIVAGVELEIEDPIAEGDDDDDEDEDEDEEADEAK